MIIYCHILPYIIIYYHILSYIIIYYHILSYIITYYHILSYIIMYYHILSYIIIYYHVLSCIIIYYHILSYIIIYYHISHYHPVHQEDKMAQEEKKPNRREKLLRKVREKRERKAKMVPYHKHSEGYFWLRQPGGKRTRCSSTGSCTRTSTTPSCGKTRLWMQETTAGPMQVKHGYGYF